MWRNVKVAVMALVCSAGLACSAGMTFAAAPGASESTEDLIKSTQEEWLRCLKDAYPFYAKKTPSANYAAEMTFGACAAHEEKLWAFSSEAGISRSAFEKQKAVTKKSLMGAK